MRIVACAECGFLYANPQPSDEALAQIYGDDYFFGSGQPDLRGHVGDLKRQTARIHLSQISEYGAKGGSLLEIGCGDGYLLAEAEAAGWTVTGVEYSAAAAAKAQARLKHGKVWVGETGRAEVQEAGYDVCVMADVLEHVRNPRETLRAVWRWLKPGGCLLLATPTLDSWSARLMGKDWMEYKTEHLSYFNRRTLESLLWQTGFAAVSFEAGRKTVSLAYVNAHFSRYPAGGWRRWTEALAGVLPSGLRRRPFQTAGSGMTVVCAKSEYRERPLVSIIVPVYNEEDTVGELLDLLVVREIPNADREIIIVESNSTDRSREIVRTFEHREGVRVIWEDRPRGKGAATRLGLASAKGDVVLIQDADLEYDLEDYECLLEPILSGREAFVLGARHGGGVWKMRQFQGAYGTSLVMNLAHWVFTMMINVCFGQRMKDPFTMFKVFRRDAIAGIEFQCARFDFDWELLIQLVRKGYRPLEIPVNYRSRSYSEGKKVRFFYDPLTWLATLARLRLGARPGKPRAPVSGSA